MNNSVCPKKQILASLVYIQRLINKNDLIISQDNAQDIAGIIFKIFNTAMDNKKKFESNKKNYPALNMYAKSVFYTMNYEKEGNVESEKANEKTDILKNRRFFFDKKNTEEFSFFKIKDNDKIYMLNSIRETESGMFDSIVSRNKEYFSLFENFKKEEYSYRCGIEDTVRELLNVFVNDMDFNFGVKDTEDVISIEKTSLKTKYLAREKFKAILSDDATVKNIKRRFDYTNFDLEKFVKAAGKNEDIADKVFDLIKTANDTLFILKIENILAGYEKYQKNNLPFLLKENFENIKISGDKIEMEITPVNSFIIPNFDTDKNAPFEKLNFYTLETDKDLLDRQKKIPLIPEKTVMAVNLKKKSIVFKDFKFDKKTKSLYENNTAQNVSFYTPEEYKQNRFKNSVIDEVDKGTDGKINSVLRFVTDHNDAHITIASGSPITSKPRDLVPLIAFGGMNDRQIEENKKNFTVQCGVFEIKDEFISAVLKAVKSDREIRDSVYNSIINYFSEKENKQFNEVEYFFKKAESLIEKMKQKALLDEVKAKSIDVFKFSNSFKRLITGFYYNKKLFSYNKNMLSDDIIKLLLNSKYALKEVPQILNPKSLISLIESVGNPNTSIQTRENLKNRKENVGITDKETFLRNMDNVKNKKETDIDNIAKNNDLKTRLLQAGINLFKTDMFLEQTYGYLSDIFKDFVEIFTKDKKKNDNLVNLSLILNTDVTEIKNYLEKTTVSASDSFRDIYVQYLKMNGDFNRLEKKFVKDEYTKNKMEFFKKFLKIFDFYKKAVVSFKGNDDKSVKTIENAFVINGHKFIKSTSFRYQAEFKVGDNTLSTESIKLKNGYPEGMVFSVKIDLVKDEYKNILKDRNGLYLPYSLELVNPEENAVLDVRGSKGIAKEIKNGINENKSLVISSSRVAGLVFNLLDTLIEAGKRENKSRPLSVIVNMTSSIKDFDLKDIISRIDTEYLTKNNIIITPVTRNMLDAQVKLDSKKGYQIALLSNYESIARGLDLSMLDKIIATGGMAKGKEFVQFVSRLFSVEKDSAEISMFHGGKDIDLFFKQNKKNTDIAKMLKSILTGELNERECIDFIKDNEHDITVKATQTSKIQKESLDKFYLYKMFMSGDKMTAGKNAENSSLVTILANSPVIEKAKKYNNSNIMKI